MLTDLLIIICYTLQSGQVSFSKRACFLFVVCKAPKLLFAKNYEVGFQLSVHQGEHMLMLNSLVEWAMNIDALKPFT